jgi:hypothetical protein
MTAPRLVGMAVVFVGPTLPAAEVRALVPGAAVMGPAKVGDVLEAAHGRDVGSIAVIDGYFEGMAAIWHKEILFALERGQAVWGAASMGALRAAELAPFGMFGVGAIYRAFASGKLVADDEVAVAHLPAAYGFRATSDALVDLRHGLARAAAAGAITARTRDALVELARRRHYRERSWAQLDADGRAAAVSARQLAQLAAFPKPSLKAADARLLLRRLAAARGRRTDTPPRVPRTWAFRRLLERAHP